MKKIKKIRVKINEIENRQTIESIKENKHWFLKRSGKLTIFQVDQLRKKGEDTNN